MKFNKEKIKSFIGKVIIFIFCIVFVNGYIKIFGAENSTIAIVLLTGLLMFLKNDLGFKAKQAAFCFPLLYLIMILSSKISLINPYIGIVINIISIGFILIISSYKIGEDNQIPFLLGYIFCQGYDVSGELFEKRIISVIIISSLIGIIYYMKNRKNTYEKGILDVFKELNIHSEKTQWYIKLALTLTLTMFLGSIFGYPRTIWISFAVLSLVRHEKEEYRHRLKRRLIATMIGTALFFIVFTYLVPQEYQVIVSLLAGFIMMFLDSYFVKTIANSFTALISATVLFSTTGAAEIRIISNIIGIIIVLICQALFEVVFDKIKLNRENKKLANNGIVN